MQDWSKKRNDFYFALDACLDVVVAGQTGKDVLKRKLWNGTIAFPCEQKQIPIRNRSVPT